MAIFLVFVTTGVDGRVQMSGGAGRNRYFPAFQGILEINHEQIVIQRNQAQKYICNFVLQVVAFP